MLVGPILCGRDVIPLAFRSPLTTMHTVQTAGWGSRSDRLNPPRESPVEAAVFVADYQEARCDVVHLMTSMLHVFTDTSSYTQPRFALTLECMLLLEL